MYIAGVPSLQCYLTSVFTVYYSDCRLKSPFYLIIVIKVCTESSFYFFSSYLSVTNLNNCHLRSYHVLHSSSYSAPKFRILHTLVYFFQSLLGRNLQKMNTLLTHLKIAKKIAGKMTELKR